MHWGEGFLSWNKVYSTVQYIGFPTRARWCLHAHVSLSVRESWQRQLQTSPQTGNAAVFTTLRWITDCCYGCGWELPCMFIWATLSTLRFVLSCSNLTEAEGAVSPEYSLTGSTSADVRHQLSNITTLCTTFILSYQTYTAFIYCKDSVNCRKFNWQQGR